MMAGVTSSWLLQGPEDVSHTVAYVDLVLIFLFLS
jgi:hypothetical protein